MNIKNIFKKVIGTSDKPATQKLNKKQLETVIGGSDTNTVKSMPIKAGTSGTTE